MQYSPGNFLSFFSQERDVEKEQVELEEPHSEDEEHNKSEEEGEVPRGKPFSLYFFFLPTPTIDKEVHPLTLSTTLTENMSPDVEVRVICLNHVIQLIFFWQSPGSAPTELVATPPPSDSTTAKDDAEVRELCSLTSLSVTNTQSRQEIILQQQRQLSLLGGRMERK